MNVETEVENSHVIVSKVFFKKENLQTFESQCRGHCDHNFYISIAYTTIFFFSFHGYSQNLVLQNTRLQTVPLKVNFPLFLLAKSTHRLCVQRFDHDLLFHINALLGCDVWTFRTRVQVPSGILCKTTELRRCHEVWSTSRHSSSAQHCPAGLPWHCVQENSPDRGKNAWRLFTISHDGY